ncbi:MAG: ribonuclease P protein component [Gemmatimonadota bacterium]
MRPRGAKFPRKARIRLSAEIRALLERGKRRRTKNLDVFFAASPASHSRLGVIVPKHGHTIVERNLVKRRLREIGRREALPRLADAGADTDVLVRARRTAYGVTYEALRDEFLETLEKMWSQSS